jgi:hypothetical protein
LLILRNPTAGALSPRLIGNAATIAQSYGAGVKDVSPGTVFGPVAVGGVVAIDQRRRIRLRQRRSAGDLAAQADIEAIEAILPAITSPAVKLDAMGCFIVSAEPPSLEAHA